MMSSNWMVKVAISNQKALIEKYGYSKKEVEAMSMAETSKLLKKLGHKFEKRNNHGCP